MAKVKVEIKSKFASQEKINRIIRDSGVLQKVGDAIVEEVRDGVNPANGLPIKRVSSKYAKRRDQLAKYNRTDPNAPLGTTRSNLTFTGQLLKSIRAFINAQKSIITIKPSGIHKGIYTSPKRRGKPVKNEDILSGQKQQGRDILRVTPRLLNIIKDIIKKELKNNL